MNRNNANNDKRNIVKIFVVLVLFVVLSMMVQATSISEINAPTSINEGDLLEINFTTEDAINNYIYQNNVLVSSSESYSWQTTYSDAGTYIYKFEANGTNSSTQSTKTITVVNVPLILTINEPEETDYNSSNVEIAAIVNRNSNYCNYEVGSESGTLNKNGLNFSVSLQLNEGNHELIINCSDGFDTVEESVSFTIDQTAPIITSAKPDNTYANPVEGTQTTLELITNEKSECRFATIDTAFNNMNLFSTTNDLTHYQRLNGLNADKHEYYFKCKDVVGNKMTSSKYTSFYSNAPPTAEITIDTDPPLKDGTYEVTLSTSEDLVEIPTLSYNYQNSQGKIPVSLTGEGDEWSGYIIIPSSTSNSVGTFYFSGKDLQALTGTEITAGKLFLVDTTSPSDIGDVELTPLNGKMKVKWHYSENDAYKFFIYRSTTSGVSYTDYYDATTEMNYEDFSAEEGVVYYYKIAAVDEAGNEGPLSVERSAIINKETIKERTLNKDLVVKVDQKIDDVKKRIIDADWAITNLNSETDETKSKVIQQLDLLNKANNAKNKLNDVSNQLLDLKSVDLSETELNNRLEQTDQTVKTYLSEIAKRVNIIEKSEYEQSFDDGDFQFAINEILSDETLSDEERSDYLKRNKELQDLVTIGVEILSLEIDYFEKDAEEHTFIFKTITSSEELKDIYAVEDISKQIAEDVSDIMFYKTPVILKKDPVIRWSFSNLKNEEMIYMVEKVLDLNIARDTKTTVLYQPKVLKQKEVVLEEVVENEITGQVIDAEAKGIDMISFSIVLGIIIISGLSIYYFMFLKEDEQGAFVTHNKIQKTKRMKIVSKPITGSVNHNMNSLINEAHQSADAFNFDKTYKIYLSILHLFSAADFVTNFEKLHVGQEINKIYTKMIVFSKIKQGHNCLKNNDLAGLKKTLLDIEKLSSMHEFEDTPFSSYVKKSQNYFSVALIGLGQLN